VTRWSCAQTSLHRVRFSNTKSTRRFHGGPAPQGKSIDIFDSSDIRSRTPRFSPEARRANQVLIDLISKIGEEKEATPAQIALAWLLAQKPWIFPIPGSRKLERLEENIGAVAVELAAEDLQEIESALSKITVQGDRYPKDMAKMSGR
jgi:aryl-alcohol dehydrogenase-like predicted oxidoreductase